MSELYHIVQLPLFVLSKVCPKCIPPTEKSIDEFPKDKSRKDEHGVYCKKCASLKSHNYHVTHTGQRYAADPNYAKKVRANNRKWCLANPKKRREQIRRYYARKYAAPIGKVSYKHILERDGYWCYICEQDIFPHQRLDFDHVIPLFRGGSHTEENIKPTHRICNQRKNKRLLEEMTPLQRRGVI